MTYQEIKDKRQEDINTLFTTTGVFWAFSREQFDQNKTPLQEGEKYVSIGAGGYMPKSNVDRLTSGMKSIEKTFKENIKENKAREAHILYELNNHECFYTGNIDSAMDALGDGYTIDEVREVYKKRKAGKYVVSGIDNQLQKYA